MPEIASHVAAHFSQCSERIEIEQGVVNRPGARQLFDIHSAFGRSHHHRPALKAVHHTSQIKFFDYRLGLFNIKFSNDNPFGSSLVRYQCFSEQ